MFSEKVLFDLGFKKLNKRILGLSKIRLKNLVSFLNLVNRFLFLAKYMRIHLNN